MTHRYLSEIAAEIQTDWKSIFYGAVPYVDAMRELKTLHDRYYHDTAKSIVTYFLANAGTWRGPAARRIKAELNTILKEYRNAKD